MFLLTAVGEQSWSAGDVIVNKEGWSCLKGETKLGTSDAVQVHLDNGTCCLGSCRGGQGSAGSLQLPAAGGCPAQTPVSMK